MSTQPTPGVYVTEVQSPSIISGVPTSIAAFVGVTATGPIGQPTLITSWAEYARWFGGLAWQAMVPWAVYEFFAEGGSSCYVLRVADTAATAPQARVGPLSVQTATPGLWGEALHCMLSPVSPGDDSSGAFSLSVLVDATQPPDLMEYSLWNALEKMAVNGQTWWVLERFGPAPVDDIVASINSQSLFVRASPVGVSQPPAGDGPTPLTGGTVSRPDLLAALPLLDSVREISLLAMPDTVHATGPDAQASAALQASLIIGALAYCQNRTSVFFVADPPAGLDVPGMLSFRDGPAQDGSPVVPGGDFGALYYPWVGVANPAGGVLVPVPPSGAVLGRYASTDASSGVWQAPAGVVNGALMSVAQLAAVMTDADQGLLNPAGINCLRLVPGQGPTIWGARTLSSQPDRVYVQVRRLVIYVEQSLRQGLQWTVFEPNSTTLWGNVSMQTRNFMDNLWRQGALAGSTPSQAYFVICDASNNPPDSQLAGVLNLNVGLAPVNPGEFVLIQLALAAAPTQ